MSEEIFGCQISQLLDSDDYFKVFGLPRTFKIDNALLKERYLYLQKRYHPDKRVGVELEDGANKRLTELSAYINSAYITLRDDLGRARLLIKLEGSGQIEPCMDQAFLMEQMQLNEELEEALNLSDIVKLNALMSSIVVKKDNISEKIDEHYLARNLVVVNDLVYRLSFYMSLINKVASARRKLEVAF